ncbi:hypothetical protein ACNQVK_29185 [Mycobacterium sp. 134]|uniref:hypothetical protein n=1 Tax=Mycobacterium sp. 134 TaxID=3400425 RepID=UPI003AAEA4C6
MADPTGMWGFPYDVADAMMTAGSPAEIAAELAALHDAGVERVTVNLVGNWFQQIELLTEAARMLA